MNYNRFIEKQREEETPIERQIITITKELVERVSTGKVTKEEAVERVTKLLDSPKEQLSNEFIYKVNQTLEGK